MSFNSPLVSVLMPVYNAGPHVEEAIRSILEQTFSNFEFIIFNDGSKDNSSSIIKGIIDERILFFDYTQNAGYVAHLNKGLQISRGKYIARMDADDIALPDRFLKQVALLEKHPEIGLCGTAYDTFDAHSSVVAVPISDMAIREYMLANSPMGHPTVMFRKSLVEQYNLRYDPSFMPTEDYKLWYEFSKIAKIENLPDVLLHYRVHLHQISSYMNGNQKLNADRVRRLQLIDKGFNLSESEYQQYCQMLNHTARPQTAKELENMRLLMWKIIGENERLQAYNSEWFKSLFRTAWCEAVNNILSYTPMHLRPLLGSKPMNDAFSLSTKLRVVAKSLLSWKVNIKVVASAI